MTKRALLAGMDSRELSEWLAFYRVEEEERQKAAAEEKKRK